MDAPPSSSGSAPFWETKALEELTEEEWESLCDGCGRCCLVKVEDEETGARIDTRLACRLLDIGACRCSDYANRHEQVPDCVRLTPQTARDLDWLPDTCAYRLRAEGKRLYWWHPLRSGDPETVHQAGISVRHIAMSETKAAGRNYEDYAMRPREGRAAARRVVKRRARKRR
ncbi:YcgN family cysteine cluster protein [Dichotomicrobium thermohalophilum]|uniref:YcgN family cysteine cluster protein n=1 Tax=Dichotomicrobium thermohalophilum TaxID=933063 RepID=UPI003CCAD3DA